MEPLGLVTESCLVPTPQLGRTLAHSLPYRALFFNHKLPSGASEHGSLSGRLFLPFLPGKLKLCQCRPGKHPSLTQAERNLPQKPH
jgi:hypothetical protein